MVSWFRVSGLLVAFFAFFCPPCPLTAPPSRSVFLFFWRFLAPTARHARTAVVGRLFHLAPPYSPTFCLVSPTAPLFYWRASTICRTELDLKGCRLSNLTFPPPFFFDLTFFFFFPALLVVSPGSYSVEDNFYSHGALYPPPFVWTPLLFFLLTTRVSLKAYRAAHGPWRIFEPCSVLTFRGFSSVGGTGEQGPFLVSPPVCFASLICRAQLFHAFGLFLFMSRIVPDPRAPKRFDGVACFPFSSSLFPTSMRSLLDV